MVLNAYDSAILKSQMDFSIWAMKKGIKNPVEKKIESEKKEKPLNIINLLKKDLKFMSAHLYIALMENHLKNSTIVSKEKADLKQKRIIK